ncbi:MAG: glycoside hydrolase family 4 [Chloroflexi bacterium]|nr:glycoside hydrolase family 4 [Chloroflexota bacterium]
MSSQKQYPKVVVIGAGSLFFGRQSIWQMVHSPHLNQGTLALVDTDGERLKAMATLAEMAISANGVPLDLEASIDRTDVLKDADFVVLSFADRSVKFRGIDCEISAKYGVRMCSGDTIGPGGIFRAMREFPVILDCARDIEALCPDAWVINYINPTTVHGLGLRRYAPRLKSFALCDGLHMPHVKRRYALKAGIINDLDEYDDEIDTRFDLRIAGVNHFTWILKAEYDGRDVAPAIAESIHLEAEKERDSDHGAKLRYNNTITHSLYQIFGYIPTAAGHTKEYVRFWQGLNRSPEDVPPLSLWETDDRYRLHEAMWQQVDDFIAGRIPIQQYTAMFGPDHATDVIENMVGNLGKPFYINTYNQGAVTNMADDAFLELCCDIDMEGPRPRPVGAMPAGLHGMQRLVLDTHELTADAVAQCSHALLRRAMLTDPLLSSIADADAIIAELLRAERDTLPDCWFS